MGLCYGRGKPPRFRRFAIGANLPRCGPQQSSGFPRTNPAFCRLALRESATRHPGGRIILLPCSGGNCQLSEMFDLFIRGIVAGIAISAPVGPVNVLCVSRTLSGGRRGGLVSGLGAAAGDTIYGAIAAFSISFVIQFLLRELHWIRLIGGSLLIAIGIYYCLKKPRSFTMPSDSSAHSDFITAFLLNLTNPTVVLSFLAVLAA